MHKIQLIAAIGKNNIIGIDGKMPWYNKFDLMRFSKLTKGHCVLMGRKTAESLPGQKPLPNRRNIVFTKRDQSALVNIMGSNNFIYVGSFEEALSKVGANQKLFIAGGAQIYKQLYKYCSLFRLTYILQDFEMQSSNNIVRFPQEILDYININCIHQKKEEQGTHIYQDHILKPDQD